MIARPIAALATCFVTSAALAAEPTAEQLAFFEKHIRPVLAKECYGCHSAKVKEPKGGLLLDTKAGMITGGESGPAIAPGKPDESPLLDALRHETFEMPPSGKLDDAVIAHFATWIAAGAPDPRTGNEPAVAETSGDLWSLQPPQRVDVPTVKQSEWPWDDVDRYLLARQENAGVAPVADADRPTWLRRVTFDLTGLPPTPAEVANFLADDSAGAHQRVVDRLLASKQFGERWGRHWLDVARFAESTGHERNFTFPHAWRYRDYVIAAFNADKPYDEFVREQVAGDLLPAGDWRARDEHRTATGFLALGPKALIGGPDAQYRADVVDDQINVVSQAILGLTVSCARCHDHKFDPVSTRDYYALAGVFHSTEPLYGTRPGSGGGSNKRPSELYPLGPKGAALHEQRRKVLDEVDALEPDLKKARSAYKKARDSNQDEKAEKFRREVKRIERRQKELRDQAPPAPSYAMGVREAKKPVDTHVLVNGEVRNEGDEVPRGLPAVLRIDGLPEIAPDRSGRRVLAEWLTHPQNPLTARVHVNRVWQHLFGEGLVETVDNFGHTGRAPTHPALLDHLALEFVEDGWSTKRLVRRLVLSHAYRLSSQHDAANRAVDPDDVLLWRMRSRRLEGEAIRDAMLAVSGQLETAPPTGGSVVAELGDGCLVRQIKPGPLFEPRPYRSVYLPSCRYFVPEALELFDAPSPSLVTGLRAVTQVPAQTLFLLNDDFVLEQSARAADRLLQADVSSDAERVDLAYELALGRPPTSVEREEVLNFLTRAEEGFGSPKPRATWAAFCQALFLSAEFRHVH